MRIKPLIFGILVIVIYLGVVKIFQAAGIWSVSGKITAEGQAVQPLAQDVNTIKGWMTLEQISNTYNVTLAELLSQFDLPADTPGSTPIKDLETETFSVTELKTWLESLNQTPQTIEATEQQATPTPSQLPVEAVVTPQTTDHVAPEKTITGKTTFQDLLDWGVTEQTIQKVIGADLPALSTIIKDYATQIGLEFFSIKAALQAEIDQIK